MLPMVKLNAHEAFCCTRKVFTIARIASFSLSLKPQTPLLALGISASSLRASRVVTSVVNPPLIASAIFFKVLLSTTMPWTVKLSPWPRFRFLSHISSQLNTVSFHTWPYFIRAAFH